MHGVHVGDGYVGCDIADDKTCSERFDDHLTFMDVDTAVFGCHVSFEM